MQECFLVIRSIVHDPERMKSYSVGALPMVEMFGGEYVVRSEEVTALEGQYDGRRLIIVRFPDMERFQELWNSPEYEELRQIRLSATTGEVWLVPGAVS